MPQGFLDFLARQGILENTDESNYVFTYSGFSMVRMLHENLNIAKLIKNQHENVLESPDHMFA